jgi:hypothetical protein
MPHRSSPFSRKYRMRRELPSGIRVGNRLVVIRDGRFVGKTQKKGDLRADSKSRRPVKAG